MCDDHGLAASVPPTVDGETDIGDVPFSEPEDYVTMSERGEEIVEYMAHDFGCDHPIWMTYTSIDEQGDTVVISTRPDDVEKLREYAERFSGDVEVKADLGDSICIGGDIRLAIVFEKPGAMCSELCVLGRREEE